MMYWHILFSSLIAIFSLTARESAALGPRKNKRVASSTSDSARAETLAAHCQTLPHSVVLRGRSAKSGLRKNFPALGHWATESHYVTTSDTSFQKRYPRSQSEGIASHLSNSCRLLQRQFPSLSANCAEVYHDSWERRWTPSEGGTIGQGARSKFRPSLTEEMWQGNMMFAGGHLPPHGTRYLLRNPSNGRAAVISFGFERGPANTHRYLGGLSSEAIWYLGSDRLEVSYLANQHAALGPTHCP
jgi:hypothetical protein